MLVDPAGRIMSLTPLDIAIGTYVTDLAAAVGLVLVDEKPAPYTYDDGRTFIRRAHLEPVTVADLSWRIGERRDLVDLLHEIAHFQVCPRRRIGMPDFGLGMNGFSVKFARLAVSKRLADDEEHRAMVLGFYHAGPMRRQLHRLIDGRLEGIGYPSWQAFRRAPSTRRVLAWLETRGLIRHGRATRATVHGRRWC